MVWLVMQLWPFPYKNAVSFKALEPIGRELKTVGKVHLLPLLHSSTCNALGPPTMIVGRCVGSVSFSRVGVSTY